MQCSLQSRGWSPLCSCRSGVWGACQQCCSSPHAFCTSSLSPDVYPPCAAKRLREYSECGWSATIPFILWHCQHGTCGDPPWHFLLSPFAVNVFFPAWSTSVILVSVPKGLGSLSLSVLQSAEPGLVVSRILLRTVPLLETSPARSSGTGAQMQEMSWEEVRKKPTGVV